MRFAAVVIAAAASAGLVSAACGEAEQAIVNACLANMEPQLNLCKTQDYICLCAAYTKISDCYNSCESDPRSYAAESEKTQNCQFAQTQSTSSTPQPTMTPTGTAMTTGTDMAVPKTGLGGSGSTSTSSELAGSLGVPVGGALAMVLGVAGLL